MWYLKETFTKHEHNTYMKGKEAMVKKLAAMIPILLDKHKVSYPICLTWKEDLANQLYQIICMKLICQE